MTKEELYEQVKRTNPTWTDEQIWSQVSVMISSEEAISSEGPNCVMSQDLLRNILEKAKDWLFNVLPEIFEKVYTYIDNLISNLPDWAKDGLKYIFKFIGQYLNQPYNGY